MAEVRAWSPNLDLARLLPPGVFAQSELSLLALDDNDVVAGFVLALKSHGMPDTGYVHFIWVNPANRGAGLADELYEELFEVFRRAGCRRVEAVTAATNTHAIALHRRLGFTIGPIEEVEVEGGHSGVAPVQRLVHLSRELLADQHAPGATPDRGGNDRMSVSRHLPR